MVTKIINGLGGGNLNNTGDFFGIEDDRIVVQSASGAIYTYGGNDIVDDTRNSSITQYASLGFGNDQFFGGSAAEIVEDGDGTDIVSLGGGNDWVYVGAGNDVFVGGAGADTVSFKFESWNGSGANPLNFAGVSFDLAKTGAQNLGAFGVDQFSGFENVEGGSGADHFFGSAGVDMIDGAYGNDSLDGRAGRDILIGGEGKDVFIGGAGADILQGGELFQARDIFKFNAISDSGVTATTWDLVAHFDKGLLATSDRIDLSAIDANPFLAGNQAFKFLGAGAFTAAKVGELRLTVSGGNTFVHLDTDHDNGNEMVIEIDGVVGLHAADFIL
jgi:Ca2+-binding RTX toxin-like protein